MNSLNPRDRNYKIRFRLTKLLHVHFHFFFVVLSFGVFVLVTLEEMSFSLKRKLEILTEIIIYLLSVNRLNFILYNYGRNKSIENVF